MTPSPQWQSTADHAPGPAGPQPQAAQWQSTADHAPAASGSQPKSQAASFFQTLASDVLGAPAKFMDWATSEHPIDAALDTIREFTTARQQHQQMAAQAYQNGDYKTAAEHALFSVPFVGPMLGAAGEEAKTEPGAAAAHMIEIAAPTLLPEVLGAVRELVGKGAGAVGDAIKFRSTLNPTQQAAVDYIQANLPAGATLPAGTVTGNKFLKGAASLAGSSPLGASVAGEAGARLEAGLQDIAGQLANAAHPKVATPESAGFAASDALSEKIAALKIGEDAAYKDAWKGADDPRFTENVPVRTEQRAALDASGKPTGQMESVPVMAKVQMPVDVRGIKEQLGPVWDSMQWMPASDQASSAGYQAVKKILNGPDFIPATAAEQGLGGLKTMARVGNTNLRNTSQGMAAGIIPDLQENIDAAVAKTGPEALSSLQAGRATHASKMEVADVADQLRDEPVQAFNQLTWRGDTGIDFLRRIGDQAPDALPKIGRAYLQKLFDQATAEGGFSRAAGIGKQWENLGPLTKGMLYPNAELRSSLDNFFLGAKMAADNPNPSGTALVRQTSSIATEMLGSGVLALHDPMAGAVGLGAGTLYMLGGRAVAKLLYSPEGVKLLTGGLQLETPAAAAMRAAQILRIAGDDDVTPMPPPEAPKGGSPGGGSSPKTVGDLMQTSSTELPFGEPPTPANSFQDAFGAPPKKK